LTYEENIWRPFQVRNYAANPGDNVRTRWQLQQGEYDRSGWEAEQALQESFDNFYSSLEPGPADRSAVDGLPLIAIEQRHLEDGTLVCTICQETIPIGEHAKKLPCSHFYHEACILTWFENHNVSNLPGPATYCLQ
jgi:E3 ubiquitin-protein ligase RNF115/126